MATTYAPTGVALNKVVVAYLDDRRLHGCVFDFSPLKDTFRLVAERERGEDQSRLESGAFHAGTKPRARAGVKGVKALVPVPGSGYTVGPEDRRT